VGGQFEVSYNVAPARWVPWCASAWPHARDPDAGRSRGLAVRKRGHSRAVLGNIPRVWWSRIRLLRVSTRRRTTTRSWSGPSRTRS